MGSKSKKLAIETLKAWLEDIKRGKGRPKPQKDHTENIRK
jgi:hypothetical protein